MDPRQFLKRCQNLLIVYRKDKQNQQKRKLAFTRYIEAQILNISQSTREQINERLYSLNLRTDELLERVLQNIKDNNQITFTYLDQDFPDSLQRRIYIQNKLASYFQLTCKALTTIRNLSQVTQQFNQSEEPIIDFQTIENIFSICRQIMSNDQQFKDNFGNHVFILCYLIYILKTLRRIIISEDRNQIVGNPKNINFQFYRREKLIYNFRRISEYYCKKISNNTAIQAISQANLLFTLVNKEVYNDDFIEGIWILFKVYTDQLFQSEPPSSQNKQGKFRPSSLRTHLQLLLDDKLEMLKYFQGCLINRVQNQNLFEEPVMKIRYDEYRIKQSQGIQKFRNCNQRYQMNDDQIIFKERMTEILSILNRDQLPIKAEQFSEQFIIYANSQYYKMHQQQPNIPCTLNQQKIQQYNLNKYFKITVQQLRLNSNSITFPSNSFQILQCKQSHIIYISFFKDKDFKQNVKQQSKSSYIRSLRGKKITYDIKVHSGKYGIIKVVILYFDQKSFDWGNNCPKYLETNDQFYHSMSIKILHDLRKQKHSLLLSLDLPISQMIEQTQITTRILQARKKRSCFQDSVTLTQAFFNIYLQMIDRDVIFSSHPIHHTVALYVVFSTEQFLKFPRQNKPSFQFEKYIKTVSDHIITEIGYGIDYQAIDSFRMFEKMMKQQSRQVYEANTAAQKCRKIFQFIKESLKRLEDDNEFHKFNSFWSFLMISRKIYNIGKNSKGNYSAIINRQHKLCKIYNAVASSQLKEKIILLELYYLLKRYGQSAIRNILLTPNLQIIDRKDVRQQVVNPLLEIMQMIQKILSSLMIDKNNRFFEAIVIDFFKNQFNYSLTKQLLSQQFPLTQQNRNINNMKIYELRYQCIQDCQVCKDYKPFQRNESCCQRFAFVLKYLQILNTQKSPGNLNDKELMKKYKNQMKYSYNLMD